MRTEICSNCKFFENMGMNEQVRYEEIWGRCRRKAPVLSHSSIQSLSFGKINFEFPGMPIDGWCGEFETQSKTTNQ